MIAAGGGSIINFGSITWMLGQGGMVAYSTAKAAVHGLTRSLARDLGAHGIRVNAIAPGWVMTKRQIEMWLTPEGDQEREKGQALKGYISPDDVARLVLFLCIRRQRDDHLTDPHYRRRVALVGVLSRVRLTGFTANTGTSIPRFFISLSSFPSMARQPQARACARCHSMR